MNKNYSIETIDRLINGKNVLKFINFDDDDEVYNSFDRLVVLVYNLFRDKDNEQHRNITLIGNINDYSDELVLPDTVDAQYQLIIIRSYTSTELDEEDSIPIYTKLLNKSQSYAINIRECQFEQHPNFFQQSQIINDNRYDLISIFPNCNGINKVYLVCGADQRLIYYKDNQKCYERAENEIKAMELLKENPNFVLLIDHHDDKENQIFHIITEYCDGGDLAQEYKLLTDLNQFFEESDISEYISQLFNILLELDNNGIVHCDIKPSNIFIHDGTLTLGDFGCCKFIDEYQDTQNQNIEQPIVISNLKFIDNEISEPSIFDMDSNTLQTKATRGTIGYISPEAKNRQYAQSCDIFSIGSTMLKLLCCHQDDRNNHELFKSKGEIIISETRYSKQLIDFIHLLLDQSPKNRESLQQLLNLYIEAITNQDSITFNVNTPFP
ncbi:hypothetical protein PPL_01763 [Heterostelium album PN500]|uniref:non-specific serine/threonine protein kinase n=1 Tax=Heterostelium pallidum (strain ATCC 26659 / Pp 5 / PN500) TaxID=670386 RepID=D3B0E7_HETP5|nr:hypothetical protein PPL_01763 [Heterostelium album PN500]EFA84771.1 hypothetical protein PPL_01763 [Heterostelium album PN500]|eukprot:XP_020436883.1 hypothetical protein PPL_01763 [Heterostelium album PN500]